MQRLLAGACLALDTRDLWASTTRKTQAAHFAQERTDFVDESIEEAASR